MAASPADCWPGFFFVFFLFVPSGPHTNSQVHIQTHKPDQAKMDLIWPYVLRNSCRVPYLFSSVIFLKMLRKDSEKCKSRRKSCLRKEMRLMWQLRPGSTLAGYFHTVICQSGQTWDTRQDHKISNLGSQTSIDKTGWSSQCSG